MAAAKSWSGKKVMKLLLAARSNGIDLDYHLIFLLIKHFDAEIILPMLDAASSIIELTDEMISATMNKRNREEILRLFFHDRRDKVQVSKGAVVQVELSCSYEMMRLVLDRIQDKIEITDEVLIADARNKRGASMLRLLLDRADKSHISEEVVMAAMIQGADKLEPLLEKHRKEIQVTEDMLVAAAGHWYAKEMLGLLFDQKPGAIDITENVIIAAAENKRSRNVM